MVTFPTVTSRRKFMAAFLSFMCLSAAATPAHAVSKAKYRVSTSSSLWASETNAPITSGATGTGTIAIDTTTKYQTIDAFGGCFNEIGAKALKAVDTSLSNRVMRELFDTVSTISIARDKIYLIPFIKSAMVYRPDLKMWASPWSPPKWMKVNNDVPAANFIQTPTILKAYALYLDKAVKLFQAEGINLYALSVQNEPYTNNSYPCCLWNSAQIRDFIKLYVGPRFASDQVNCQIWSPTMNNGSLSEFTPWLSDQGSAQYVKAVCFQWEGENAIAGVHAAYPSMTLYETELKCGGGTNDWSYAEGTCFQQMLWYFDNYANGFMQWNMVLDQSNTSAWGWVQCGMITVDTTQKTVAFHPQHYCAKHFSYYIKPGAKRIKTSGTFSNQVGFKNPDGSVIVVANNDGNGALTLAVSLGTSVINVSAPAHSFDTYVFYDSLTSVAAGPSKNGPQLHATSLLKIAKSGNAISIVPQGTTFDLRVVGVDGRVKSSLSSKTADALRLRSGEMAPGIYFIKGMVDGKNCTATLPIQE